METKNLKQNDVISEAVTADESEHHSGRVALQAQATGSHAIGAQAIGALAVGALAIGTLAIWRLAISQLFVRRSKIITLEVDDLIIKRLRVGELTVIDNLVLHDSGMDKK